jgi:hypothetical protein
MTSPSRESTHTGAGQKVFDRPRRSENWIILPVLKALIFTQNNVENYSRACESPVTNNAKL